MANPTEAVRAFRRLHEAGCFVLPNPWDIGSALFLRHLGFRALATTSSGFAWSRGRADNHIALDQALAHMRELSAAVDLPVNADFEGGFAIEPEAVGANVAAGAATGVAGLSIEDSTGDARSPLFDFALAVERVRAARKAIDDGGSGVVLVGRSEGFVVGRPDLRETIHRLNAYAEAGAECLYAPGVRSLSDVETIVREVAPLPVNVLAWSAVTVQELEDIGVRRISIGGALARAAWRGLIDAAKEVIERGTFEALGSAARSSEIEAAFGAIPQARG
jgi:2-methylisocitrate lyase-like PEP mutase family enzyme